MESFLRIALSNAVLATIAALLAWVAGSLIKKPALTHALWLIVLLKLVTPPLWTVPVRLPAEPRSAQQLTPPPAATVRESERTVADLNLTTIADAPDAEASTDVADATPQDESIATQGPSADLTTVQTYSSPAPPTLPAPTPTAVDWRRWVESLAIAGWLVGAVWCLCVSVSRIVAFRRVLRYAVPAASAVQERADVLSGRLGLGEAPKVAMVPGAVCPMLWSAGTKARVLVPRGLWDRLDGRQRDTLLLHELAHLRRRDHWVRWLELLVTALYWWHPVCWWARHELREAEEQCCDAWVLWAMPGAFREYASALLEAVEFVSIPSSVPLLASGMGQFGDLRRRLTMLKQGNVARALTWSGFAAACGAGALLLSVAPTLAQTVSVQTRTDKTVTTDGAAPTPVPTEKAEPQSAAPPAPSATPAPAISVVTAAPAAPEAPDLAPVPVGVGDDSAPVSPAPDALPRRGKAQPGDQAFRKEMDDVQEANSARQAARAARMQADLERSRREVADLSRRLQQAAERLKKMEMEAAQADMQSNFNKNKFDVEVRDGRITRVSPKGLFTTPAMPPQPGQFNFSQGYQSSSSARAARNVGDRDQRLEAVERQLSQLLNEVKQLRDDRNNRDPNATQQQAR